MYKKGFDAAARDAIAHPDGGKDKAYLRFREIGRDTPDRIIEQLAGNDRVHVKGAGSLEELKRFRLGGEGFDRTCFAMMDDSDKIYSAIYVLKTYESIETDRHLHGDIAGTLASETHADARSPRSLIFYSISNLTEIQGMGQKLVQNLYGYLQNAFPSATRSTLSPLRTFDQNFSQQQLAEFNALPPQGKARAVLDYILSGDRKSEVQQFHLGNGARIADIKLSSGDVAVDSETGAARRHFAMVNYAYDMDEAQLRENAVAFRDVKKMIRATDMDPELRAVSIRHKLWPVVSDAILEDTGIATALAMHGGRPRGDRPAVLSL